jgi:hypothetical protein
MTTFALHRATVESFADCMHGGAGKDTLARILAENVVLIGPLSHEPLTAAIQGVSTQCQPVAPTGVQVHGQITVKRS